jgi:HAD superfamily phosphoserine phosphatase-like hydrolase
VTLAIFDLDNTLLGGDSDNLWGQFVCEQGLVDGDDFAARNDQFYAEYQAGTLDINTYLRFALSTLVGHTREELDAWHREFMARKIEPILLPKAEQLLASHRTLGHQLLIITATNEFITRPIAELLGVSELIACEGEISDGRYTGEPRGVPT